jgi:glycosyltransferase involved in cell wall biosynthesis
MKILFKKIISKAKTPIKKIATHLFPIDKNYRVLYFISYLKSFPYKPVKSNDTKEYDLVFVIDQGNRGWILDAICKEIARYFSGNSHFSYSYYFPGENVFSHSPNNLPLPPAKAYFFAHYSYFAVCLRLHPILWNRQSFIYYTHPKGIMTDDQFAYVMNQSTKVICMCSQFAERLVHCGVNPEKVTYVLGAADPDMFPPHQRSGDGVIGFCTAYYPRKDPERILNIIKLLPHRKFILIGKDWEKYENFSELIALPNLSYVQVPYSEYPQYYAAMDVFVSPAKLEGGPIPLIESMMCNVVPVASKTGFAPDIITHGENGLLFEIDSSSEEISELIEQAFQIKSDIRKTVEHLSWKNFSLDIQKLIESSGTTI